MPLRPVISALFIKWDKIYNCRDLKSVFLIPTPLAAGPTLSSQGWRQEPISWLVHIKTGIHQL